MKTKNHNYLRGSFFSGTRLIVIVGFLLVFLIVSHFGFWPRLLIRMDNALKEGPVWSNIRLSIIMVDALSDVWYQHARQLMDIDSILTTSELDPEDLKHLVENEGVLDAFYLDLETGLGTNINSLIPIDSLISKLDVRGKSHTGGASRMGRRLMGGLTRFKRFSIGEEENPLLVRYIGTYYPANASKIVGMVLDEEWFVRKVPEVLDSLARNNTNILFAAHALPDTNFNTEEQKYKWAAPNDAWKQTLGAQYGSDTLWWFGDPNVDLFDMSLWHGNYYVYLNEFDVKVFAKAEFPGFHEEIKSDYRRATIYLVLIEALGILLIVILFIANKASRKQIERNQIALAHLAHAVKTPVARMRLSTDSLLRNLSTSPQEENKIVEEISTECSRLETAVQSAAMSLEGIGKHLQLKESNPDVLLNEIVERWRAQFESAGVKLILNSDSTEHKISIDHNLFTVMMDNLLDNALRHTKTNLKNVDIAEVSIRFNKENKEAVISVNDMGGGIPKSDLKRVFKRFGRVTGDAATGVTGLGLGLTLVREIAVAHKGSVSAENNDQDGLRVTVRLPVVDPAE